MKLNLIILNFVTTLFISGCDEEMSQNTPSELDRSPKIESFTIRNSEIRQDIINELAARNIKYWINRDNSIGFNSKDAKQIDAIGFAAIGAYAARN